MDSRLITLAEQSLRLHGVSAPGMASGAGHDAMIIAPFLPSAMIFLRSPGGLSHHPDESVYPKDVALALECGMHFLKALGSTLPYE
jgi:allantoate deiminase